jgi:hypothetical protein
MMMNAFVSVTGICGDLQRDIFGMRGTDSLDG